MESEGPGPLFGEMFHEVLTFGDKTFIHDTTGCGSLSFRDLHERVGRAAALLKEEGHDVIGATLQFRPCGNASDVQWCGSMEAQTCARTVAALLDIPH